jgi:putative DNA primase/helicase
MGQEQKEISLSFENFARGHGLIIDHLIVNKWVATSTEDHPSKRNGRYKYLGDVGWVQNWATMERPEMWRSTTKTPILDMKKRIHDANKERVAQQRKAAERAAWIMGQTQMKTHKYLEKKGFPEETAPVWEKDGKSLLVLPMRINRSLIGVQLITDEGDKQFLSGQKTKGASLTIDAKGLPIFCEGFATALTIRRLMKIIKIRYTIYCCFSAGNLQEVAREIPGGIVIADHDVSGAGEKFARQTHKPYWMPPTAGFDLNDYWSAEGDFRASQLLRPAIVAALNAGTSPRSGVPVRG